MLTWRLFRLLALEAIGLASFASAQSSYRMSFVSGVNNNFVMLIENSLELPKCFGHNLSAFRSDHIVSSSYDQELDVVTKEEPLAAPLIAHETQYGPGSPHGNP